MDDKQFYPFYEKFSDVVRLPVVGKLLVSVLLAGLFLVPHFCVIRINTSDINQVLLRWDWMLGVIIFFAMFTLYYATYTFRNLFLLLDVLWKPHEGHPGYITYINQTLSDRTFLTAACAFGFANLMVGLCFGLPDSITSTWERISLGWGYFLVGFVCGLPVGGIYGVIKVIVYLAREGTFELDYTSPDGCGGVRFLGDAIVKFSAVTLMVGVLISIYIINANWEREHDFLVNFLMWVWIAFPYILSLLIVIVPSVGINQLLRQYKFQKDCEFKGNLKELFNKINSLNNDESTQISDLKERHERITALRTQLYQMRTWPFGLSENYKYSVIFISNLIMPLLALPPVLDAIKKMLASIMGSF